MLRCFCGGHHDVASPPCLHLYGYRSTTTIPVSHTIHHAFYDIGTSDLFGSVT